MRREAKEILAAGFRAVVAARGKWVSNRCWRAKGTGCCADEQQPVFFAPKRAAGGASAARGISGSAFPGAVA